jgi:wobble nucleotide-excising tRNase
MLQSFSSDVAFRGLSRAPFTGTPPCVLGKRTVIFGCNGAGETSLTEALRLAAATGRADSAMIKACVVTNGTVASVDVAPASEIAFTYFLRSFEADGVAPSTSVVLIDDPATSLDKEALFASFALTASFAQTVVLTHDYECNPNNRRLRPNGLPRWRQEDLPAASPRRQSGSLPSGPSPAKGYSLRTNTLPAPAG